MITMTKRRRYKSQAGADKSLLQTHVYVVGSITDLGMPIGTLRIELALHKLKHRWDVSISFYAHKNHQQKEQ
jgi:hypothetical protein